MNNKIIKNELEVLKLKNAPLLREHFKKLRKRSFPFYFATNKVEVPGSVPVLKISFCTFSFSIGGKKQRFFTRLWASHVLSVSFRLSKINFFFSVL